MKDQDIEFVVGREYVTRDSRIVTLIRISDGFCFFEGGFSTHLNGYQFQAGIPASHNDIVAQYRPKEANVDFSKPVQTKNGKKVTVFTTKVDGQAPVVGQIEGYHRIDRWFENGKNSCFKNGEYDLINVKEKKVVNLGPEDIKVGDIVKYKDEKNTWQMITSVKRDVNGNNYFVAGNSNYYFDKKISNLLLSHDNGVTWQEFTKEIEE